MLGLRSPYRSPWAVEHTQPDHLVEVPLELLVAQDARAEALRPEQLAVFVQFLGRERVARVGVETVQRDDQRDDPVPAVEVDRPPEALHDQVPDIALGVDRLDVAASDDVCGRLPPGRSRLLSSLTSASHTIWTRLAW